MLKPTSAIVGLGLKDNVAFLTDGRFSGGSHGFIVGHISPESAEGGPIAYIKDGDIITIDINKNEINYESVSNNVSNNNNDDYLKYKKVVN